MTRPPDAELAMCRLERSHDPYSAALVAYVRELEAERGKCCRCPGVALMVSHGIGVTATKQLDGDRPTYTTEGKK